MLPMKIRSFSYTDHVCYVRHHHTDLNEHVLESVQVLHMNHNHLLHDQVDFLGNLQTQWVDCHLVDHQQMGYCLVLCSQNHVQIKI